MQENVSNTKFVLSGWIASVLCLFIGYTIGNDIGWDRGYASAERNGEIVFEHRMKRKCDRMEDFSKDFGVTGWICFDKKEMK